MTERTHGNPFATIRPLTFDDWAAVERIFAAGISTGNATFETQPPSWQHFDSSKLTAHRFVTVDAADMVQGWIAVAGVSTRRAYRGVVEHSVYVDPEWANRGIGSMLLNAVIASTESVGIWTIQAGIFPENESSLALHRKLGFRMIGTRERVGQHDGKWRDVVLLERRSASVGQ